MLGGVACFFKSQLPRLVSTDVVYEGATEILELEDHPFIFNETGATDSRGGSRGERPVRRGLRHTLP